MRTMLRLKCRAKCHGQEDSIDRLSDEYSMHFDSSRSVSDCMVSFSMYAKLMTFSVVSGF